MHRSVEAATLILGAALAAVPLQAQTIGEYSRAQRAQIEASISRQTPSVVPLPTLAPSTAGAVAAVAAPATGRSPAVGLPSTVPSLEPAVPRLSVTGVIAFPDRRLAEVTYDGAAYLLGAGETVPGTTWTLKSVSASEVVMSMAGRRATSRTFHIGTAGR